MMSPALKSVLLMESDRTINALQPKILRSLRSKIFTDTIVKITEKIILRRDILPCKCKGGDGQTGSEEQYDNNAWLEAIVFKIAFILNLSDTKVKLLESLCLSIAEL